MKLVISTVFLASFAFGWLYAQTGSCLYCPTYTCYARCSEDCACVTVGGSGGKCVGIQDLPELKAAGYTELP